MRFLGQVGEDEALPVERKLVLAAVGGELHAAARLAGLEQEVYLGVVPERLVVARALHGGAYSLLIEDAALVEAELQAEAALYEALQDLELHLAHELQKGGAQALVPDDAQSRVLLLELAEPQEQGVDVRAPGRDDPVAQDRLERGGLGVRLEAQALARVGVRQAGEGADRPGLRGADELELRPGIEPELVCLAAPLAAGVGAGGELGLDFQLAARDLEPGEALPVLRAAYLEYPRAEVPARLRGRAVARQGVQQRVHALQPERRAEVAGEELAPRDRRRELGLRGLGAGGDGLQQLLAAQGELVRRAGREHVHAGRAEAALQLGYAQAPVRPGEVRLVYEDKDRDAVPLQQTPERLRVALHPVRAAYDQDGAVHDLQCALGLGGEVHVARRVQQGEDGVRKVQQGKLGEDGDAPRPLERIRIQEGVAVIDPPELPQRPRAI